MKFNLIIDFELLKEQRKILSCMIQDWGEADDPQQNMDALEMEGVLNLLDDIQNQEVNIRLKN